MPAALTAPTTPTLTGPQKAAVLVMYLDEAAVRELFARMDDDAIRRVGAAISEIPRIDPEAIEQIVAEFASDLQRTMFLKERGSDYLKTVFPAVLGPERAERMLRSIEPVSRGGLQKALSRIQPGALAARLKKEHPQTVAVACAVIGPAAAGALLAHWDEDARVALLQRMAAIDRVPLELLADLKELIGAPEPQGSEHTLQSDGARLVADVLASMDGKERNAALAALKARDAELAAEVQRRMYRFELLRGADDRGIQHLLKEVDRKDLALALKGADPVTRAVFFRNISERAAAYLGDDMEAMGPVRMSDVEAAQQRIVAAALKLEESGRLMLAAASDAVVS
jgi:flagellar motor switch protein FliG